MKSGSSCEAVVQTCLYYVHTAINIHGRVCTMYIQIHDIMNMHVQPQANDSEIMYMYVHTTYNVCIFMFMYIHVHTCL
jgi:hypothetical protein